MTMIRRYIEPPSWLDTDYKVTVSKFIKDIEQLCLDAGLVKSNEVDNLDTNNIDYSGIKINESGWQSLPYLWFNLNDTMQTELPVQLGFSIAKYRNNSSSLYPPFLVVYTYVKVNGRTVSGGNYCSAHNSSGPTARNGKPYTYNNQSDSFIINNDGFISVNICPGFMEGGGTTDYTSPGHLSSVTIERSFDSGAYTAENINVFLSPSNYTVAHPMRVYVGNTESITEVQSTFIYYNMNNNNGVFSKGKLQLHTVYHIYNNGALMPSPNILAVYRYALTETAEVNAQINGINHKFIALPAGDPNFVNTTSIRTTSCNVYGTEGKLIVRVE